MLKIQYTSVGLLLGLLMGYFFFSSEKNTPVNDIVKYEPILQEVLLLSNIQIKKNSNHCELYRESGSLEGQSMLVSDYLRVLLSSLSDNSDESNFYISCDGREQDECFLNFGNGHNRMLFFKYDKKLEKINPDSFECIDIP